MDDLEARLRSLRPPDVDRNRPLPDRAEEHLKTLLSEQRAPQGGAIWPRDALLTTIAAIIAVMVVVVGAIRLDSGQAQAMTPQALEFERDDQKASDVIRTAISTLERKTGLEAPQRGSRQLGWFAQIDMDDDARSPVLIVPEIIDLRWNEDLSASQTTTAAEAYWADPRVQTPLTDAAPAPGTVISEVTFGPGEFAVPSVSAPGESLQDMRELLVSLGMPAADAGAGEIMESIDSVLSLWTLTNPQHTALLQLLLDAGDLELLGSTHDRAGRHVLGLRAEPANFPGTARTLLISADTGRIVGIETTRTTDEPPLNANDVVAYKLWEVPQ